MRRYNGGIALALLLAWGCGGDTDDGKQMGVEKAEPDAGPRVAGSSTAGSSAADAGVTFTALYTKIFKPFCVPCHGMGTAGLLMSSQAAAYQSLVSIPADPKGKCGMLGLNRVEPGDPEKSLIVLKLSTAEVPCGQQMPGGGELKPELQQMIRDWIVSGAPEN